MSRRHYEALASAIRDCAFTTEQDRTRAAYAVGRVLRDLSPYDINGNRRFDLDRFIDSCETSEPARNGGEPCPSPRCIQDAYHGGDHIVE